MSHCLLSAAFQLLTLTWQNENKSLMMREIPLEELGTIYSLPPYSGLGVAEEENHPDPCASPGGGGGRPLGSGSAPRLLFPPLPLSSQSPDLSRAIVKRFNGFPRGP